MAKSKCKSVFLHVGLQQIYSSQGNIHIKIVSNLSKHFCAALPCFNESSGLFLKAAEGCRRPLSDS